MRTSVLASAAGRVEAAVLGQSGHLFPWVPVMLACGIGLYFSVRFEPALPLLGGAGTVGVLALVAARWLGPVPRLGLIALGLVATGFALAGARAHQVAGPKLDFRYYGAIEGRVVGIDRSASDALRLTLDRVVLERMAPQDTPTRVRVSLHGDQTHFIPQPGAVVILTGHLNAPGGAVEPGGFDFRRHAWFLELGAVGYTRTPVLTLHLPDRGLLVFRIRMAISSHFQSLLPGAPGAFAAAVTSGDRSGLDQETLQNLRDTNLAHLLAISGLHMGLLAGFVFGTLRVGLLMLPHIGLRWPIKKIAAGGALAAAAAYLALSGGNVATERAFIMVAVALCAVMLDRRALSLRAVAMAALIVLLLRPEALLSPGFQMSFAATTALVVVFAVLRDLEAHRLPEWFKPIFSVFVASLVSGLATAPVGMAHFNQIAHYGLIANLVSVPIMGVLVVPAAVAAALLALVGLDWIGVWVMSLGLRWILFVADVVAGWDGAIRHVVAPDVAVLPLLALGALYVVLWQGRWRWTGFAPMVVAAVLWAQTERPDVLIADNGTLVGVMTDAGRGLSKEKGSGFIAEVWLENDGMGGAQPAHAALWPGDVSDRIAQAELGAHTIVHVQGRVAARRVTTCAARDIVISDQPLSLSGTCLLLDADALAHSGSVALRLQDTGLAVVTERAKSGIRLWTATPPDDRRLAAQVQ